MVTRNTDEDARALSPETGRPLRCEPPRSIEEVPTSAFASQQEIGESVQKWRRIVRSLERQQELDPSRKWIRARAVDVGLRLFESLQLKTEQAEDLAALREAVSELLDELEPQMDAGLLGRIDAWLSLRWERDMIARGLSEATARLQTTFEARPRRRVREWFAQDIEVPVFAGEPLPSAGSEADARALLARTEQRLRSAQAACPPRPAKRSQEVMSDWAWGSSVEGEQDRPLDPNAIDRQAEEARKTLARLPRAGPQPMWTVVGDIPYIYPWGVRLWWLAVFGGVLATLIVAVGLLMQAGSGEDAGFWRRMQETAALAWGVVVLGWLAHRGIDRWLARMYAEWLARIVPRDKAHRAIGWQYVVRRAAVEQLEAEAAALRELLSASARLRELDADPELGQRLVVLRDHSPELAVHVDAAAADLRWATPKGWASR